MTGHIIAEAAGGRSFTRWALATLAAATIAGGSPAAAQETRAPGEVFQDCPGCPEMVVVPEGAFVMGSPAAEPDRSDWEGPQRDVAVSGFAIGRTEITIAQYRAFVEATGWSSTGNCVTFEGGEWRGRPDRSWENPALPQEDSHPAVCISWVDAKLYADWLSEVTGESYRLPSEAEWEYVARAGAATAYPWGADITAGCAYANIADQTAAARFPDWLTVACNDQIIYTTPVGAYAPNAFGVYDMIGNAMEWVEDCWREGYTGAPTDGSAWGADDPSCQAAVVRGGSWNSVPVFFRSASRYFFPREERYSDFGFRVARDLEVETAAESGAPQDASAGEASVSKRGPSAPASEDDAGVVSPGKGGDAGAPEGGAPAPGGKPNAQ